MYKTKNWGIIAMINFLPIIGTIVNKVSDIIDQAVEDKDLANKIKSQIQLTILTKEYDQIAKELEARRDIIVAEAKSESWLTRNWRPITMLVFVGLITADWLGFTVPNLTPELKMKLFDIIQIGLGGYVVGRSLEKIAPSVKEILKKN